MSFSSCDIPTHSAICSKILRNPPQPKVLLIYPTVSSYILQYPLILCAILVYLASPHMSAIPSDILRYSHTTCDVLIHLAKSSHILLYAHKPCDIIVHRNVLCRNRKIIMIMTSHWGKICCKKEFTSMPDFLMNTSLNIHDFEEVVSCKDCCRGL